MGMRSAHQAWRRGVLGETLAAGNAA